MKSAHRHELETNALAHRLELYIERYKPYTSRIIGILLAIVALILLVSYLLGTSSARNSSNWDTFNQAITASPPNLDELHHTAQEFAGTPMQQISDVTWADAQVYIATRTFLANRTKALEMLTAATSAYESVVRSSKDPPLVSRARLGLARIYELQNNLDKAREEYGLVAGALAPYAKTQVERLNKPESQETYAWLSTAQLPTPHPPVGPGVPGQSPEFKPGELNLPAAGSAETPKPEDTKAANEEFDRFLKSLKDDEKKESPNQAKVDEKSADGAAPPAQSTPPSDASKKEDKPTEKAAQNAAEPATEKPEK